MVSNNINPYNIPMQAAGQPQMGGVNPSMQAGIDAQAVKQSVDHSYLANRVKASEEGNPNMTLGLTLATWYALAQAMDKFGPKCAGDYDKSVLGRIGAWGDKVQTKFTNTAVGYSSRVEIRKKYRCRFKRIFGNGYRSIVRLFYETC